jgi:dynein light intermediate chain 1
LREGFDVEAVNKGWSIDIEEPLESKPDENYCGPSVKETETPPGGSVWIYEETIRDPSLDALQATTVRASNGLTPEVDGQDPQSFLAEQLEELEKIKSEASGMDSSRQAGRQQVAASLEMAEDGQGDDKDRRVNEHIGPVQFNMGGIQVDADDMLQRLKVVITDQSRTTFR